MAESELHKQLKDAAEAWLRDNGCGIVIQEPTIAGMRNLDWRPDVFGVVTDPRSFNSNPYGWHIWNTIEVEVEPDWNGVRAESAKLRSRAKNGSSPLACHWTYLITPDDIEVNHEDFPTAMGFCRWDGNVIQYEPATWRHADAWPVTPILASMILNLQRETGRQAQEARSSNGSRLSPADHARLLMHLEQHPDDPLKAVSRDTGIDRKRLLKCAKAGIRGVQYDIERQIFSLQEAASR